MVATTAARADEFAAAALRIVSGEGIEELSVRRVAAEAGWSAGALQKAFPTKDALLDAALDLAVRRAEARMDRVPANGSVAEQITAMAAETLPLDRERRAEGLVWAAFCLRAAHRPTMAAVVIEHDRSVLVAIEEALAAARRSGVVRGDLDAPAVAHAIVAVTDGMATRLLYDPSVQATLVAALRVTVARLIE